jgi:hypothetical protein
MVHLLGVGSHIVQHDGHTPVKLALDERAAFEAHVAELIMTNDFALLAEEFSNEGRRKSHASATILQHFAKGKGIDHLFCDPDSGERQERGIGNLDYDKRKRVWLERIKGYKDRKILFVCGDDHFDSFAAKLIAAGFNVQCGRRGRIITRNDFEEGA